MWLWLTSEHLVHFVEIYRYTLCISIQSENTETWFLVHITQPYAAVCIEEENASLGPLVHTSNLHSSFINDFKQWETKEVWRITLSRHDRENHF